MDSFNVGNDPKFNVDFNFDIDPDVDVDEAEGTPDIVDVNDEPFPNDAFVSSGEMKEILKEAFEHLSLPEPNKEIMMRTGDVDLSNPEAMALFEAEIAALVAEGELTDEQARRVKDARFRPSTAPGKFKKLFNKIMDKVNASIGDISSLRSEERISFNELAERMNVDSESKNLGDQLLLHLAGIKKDPKMDEVLEVVRAFNVMLGGVTGVKDIVIDSLIVQERELNTLENRLVYTNEGGEAGAKLLNEVTDPDAKLSMLDFLGAISKAVLIYRNELYRVLQRDGYITKEMSAMKFKIQMDKIEGMDITREILQRKQRKARKKAKSLKSGQFWGGIAMMAVGVMLIAGAAFMTVASGFTLSVAGGFMIAAGVGLIVSGGMMVASAQGKDAGGALAKEMADSMDQNSATGILVAAVTVMAVVAATAATYMTPGGPILTATIAMSVATAALAVLTPAMASSITESMIDYYEDQGANNPEKKAAKDTLIIMSVFSALLIASSAYGAASSQAGSTTASAASREIARSVAAKMKSILSSMGSAVTRSGSTSAQSSTSVATASMLSRLSMIVRSAKESGQSTTQQVQAVLRELARAMRSAAGSAVTSATTTLSAVAYSPTVLAGLAEAAVTSATSIIQAKMLKTQAKVAKIKAHQDAALQVFSAAITAVSKATDAMIQGQSQIPSNITAVSDNFDKLVTDMSKSVSAITSQQRAPHAAQSTGAVTPKEKVESKANVEQAAQAANVTTAAQIEGSPIEGVEGKEGMNTSPEMKRKMALMMLMSVIANKLAKAYIAKGINPQAAQLMGMNVAHGFLKGLALLQKSGIELPKDMKSAEESPLLISLAALISKKMANKENPELSDLLGKFGPEMETEEGDEAAMKKLEQLLEDGAENDPEMKSLLQVMQQLRSSAGSNPLEFAFRSVQAYVAAMNMGSEEGLEASGEKKKKKGADASEGVKGGSKGAEKKGDETMDFLDALLGGEQKEVFGGANVEDDTDLFSFLQETLVSEEKEEESFTIGVGATGA